MDCDNNVAVHVLAHPYDSVDTRLGYDVVPAFSAAPLNTGILFALPAGAGHAPRTLFSSRVCILTLRHRSIRLLRGATHIVTLVTGLCFFTQCERYSGPLLLGIVVTTSDRISASRHILARNLALRRSPYCLAMSDNAILSHAALKLPSTILERQARVCALSTYILLKLSFRVRPTQYSSCPNKLAQFDTFEPHWRLRPLTR
jgi:hypothetical protein